MKRERDVSFEEMLSAIEQGGLLLTVEHSNRRRHPKQRIWVVGLRGYAHMVPFVETDDEVFLKTIMPSRKATTPYMSEASDE